MSITLLSAPGATLSIRATVHGLHVPDPNEVREHQSAGSPAMVDYFLRLQGLCPRAERLAAGIGLEGCESFLYPARTNRNAQGAARMAVLRVNESVLGALERPALSWVVTRLPAWVLPNHLTIVGVSGALLAGAGFVASRWSTGWLWLATFGLLANWFGDSLDGTLARLRLIERPRFGFFVDHTSDLFSQVIIFLAVGASPCAHFGVACLGLIAFLMAFVYTLIGAQVKGTMRITYFGFGPTEIRALFFLGNLLTLVFGIVDLRAWFAPLGVTSSVTIYDIVICLLAFLGATLIGALAIREASMLALEDPPQVHR
jgi:archaetidylinositol phosphate synthase